MLDFLRSPLTPPTEKSTRSQVRFWLGLSVAIALLYSAMALQEAFSGDYVVQDDARQHVFWMRRFLDPTLFPNDLIADYFQSVAPPGYTAFYHFFARFGVDPMLVNKWVPLGLGLISTVYGFGIALNLFSLPVTAFLSSWLLSQYLWSNDDILSGTARGFMLPLMLGFVYHLMIRERQIVWKSIIPLSIIIALEGLFYPTYVLIFAGILFLLPLRWRQGRFLFTSDRRDYILAIVGLAVSFLVLLPNVLETSPFGAVITAAEARTLGEFSSLGRTSFFFDDNPLLFWFSARRSGLLTSIKPALIGLGVLLPLLVRFPQRFPLARQISPQVGLLVRWGVVAIALFFLAHAVLFRLYLPSRYTNYSLQLILVFETGIVLTLLLDAGIRWAQQVSGMLRKLVVSSCAMLIFIAMLFYPTYAREFPRAEYRVGQFPTIYEFLRQQPKETMVAAVVAEADSISSFALRSTYISREHAIPYQVGYAAQFRARASALIEALYTPDLNQLRQFIQDSGVDYWLVSPDQFTVDFLDRYWIRQYREAIAQAKLDLQTGEPAIARLLPRCTVFQAEPRPIDPVRQASLLDGGETWIQTGPLFVVDSACLLSPEG